MTDIEFDYFIIGAFKEEIERAIMENRAPDQAAILRRMARTAQIFSLSELLRDIEPMLDDWVSARDEEKMFAGESIASIIADRLNELEAQTRG